MRGDLAEIDARAGDIAAGIQAAEARLRTALLDGTPTREVRAFIDRLLTQQAQLAATRFRLLEQVEADDAAQVAAFGRRVAAEVAQRLRDRLAPLLPPAAPAPVTAR